MRIFIQLPIVSHTNAFAYNCVPSYLNAGTICTVRFHKFKCIICVICAIRQRILKIDVSQQRTLYLVIRGIFF